MKTRTLGTLVMHCEASNFVGIYAQSIKYGDGTVVDRTEWQDGWNAACMEHTKQWVQLCLWFRSLPEAVQLPLCEMLAEDDVDIILCDIGYVVVADFDSYGRYDTVLMTPEQVYERAEKFYKTHSMA